MKQQIGQRIALQRKQLGITIKELAARTQSLSAARIGNWEQGTRSPGPAEAKILAQALHVSPAYLLCLSEDPRGDLLLQSDLLPRCIPLLPLSEVKLAKNNLHEIIKKLSPLSEDTGKIYLDEKIKTIAGTNTFATTIEDTSMLPDFRPGDIIIVDPDKKPNPGQYIIAHLKSTKDNIVRKYRDVGSKASAKNYWELVALNSDWGVKQIDIQKEGLFIATVIEHRRFL